MGEDWYFLAALGVLMALISYTMSFAVGRVVQGNWHTHLLWTQGLRARSLDASWAARCSGAGEGSGWGGGLGLVLALLLTCCVTLGQEESNTPFLGDWLRCPHEYLLSTRHSHDGPVREVPPPAPLADGETGLGRLSPLPEVTQLGSSSSCGTAAHWVDGPGPPLHEPPRPGQEVGT